MTVTRPLHLTKAQIQKMTSGGSFRLSPNGMAKNATRVNVRIPDHVFNSVKQAHAAGKAGVISGGSIVGGKIRFGKIGKSIARFAREGITRKGITRASHALGNVAQQAKKYVPKKVVSQVASEAVSVGLLAAGQPELIPAARVAVQSGVDATYDTNLNRGSVGKNFGRNFKNRLVTNGVGQALSSMSGAGIRRTGGTMSGSSLSGAQINSYRDQKGGRFLALEDNQTGSYLPGSVAGRGFQPIGTGFLPLG